MSDTDWIEWNGGECPVGAGELVDIRYRDHQEAGPVYGQALVWQHSTNHRATYVDIIAYRIVSQP